MGGSRNKGKKFLKQKQAKQKRRSPAKVKNNNNSNKKSANSNEISGIKSGGISRDDIANLSNSDIHFHTHRSMEDGSEFSDNISMVSELTIAVDDFLNETEQQSAYNELDEHFDNLSEKDEIMRMTTLNKINSALRRRIFDDYLRAKQCDKLYTLAANLRNSLQKGSPKEQCLALETVSLVMLTLQGNHDTFIKQIRATVLRFIQSPHSRHVQIKAIEAWTCITWVSGDDKKTQKTIELLDDIWMKRLSHKRLKAKMKAKNKQDINDINNNNETTQSVTTNDNNNKPNSSKSSIDNDNDKTAAAATYMKDSNCESSDAFSDDNTNDISNDENDTNDNNNNDSSKIESKEEEKKNDETNDDDNDIDESGSLATILENKTIAREKLSNNNNNNNQSNNSESSLFNDSGSNIALTEMQTDLLQDHSRKSMPENIAISALNNWIWLIASIGNEMAIGSLLDVYYLDLLDILEHNSNILLRCAAAEALTLLGTNYQEYHKKDNINKNIMNHNNNNSNNNGNSINRYEFDFDNLLDIFNDFMDETNQRHKNALKIQKRKFREYIRTLDESHNWKPHITIKLRGQKFEFDGWCKWIQYHCLKKILKAGFQPHLLENSNIQTAFDMENVEAPQPLTQLQKKSKLMGHADDAKQHKQKIKDERAQKQAFMFQEV